MDRLVRSRTEFRSSFERYERGGSRSLAMDKKWDLRTAWYRRRFGDPTTRPHSSHFQLIGSFLLPMSSKMSNYSGEMEREVSRKRPKNRLYCDLTVIRENFWTSTFGRPDDLFGRCKYVTYCNTLLSDTYGYLFWNHVQVLERTSTTPKILSSQLISLFMCLLK